MKTIIELLAIVLGVAGVFLLAVAGVAVWQGAGEVVGRTDRAAAFATQGLDKAEIRLTRIEGNVTDLTVVAATVGKASEKFVGRVVKEVADRVDMDKQAERLDRLVDHSVELAHTLDFVANVVDDGADMIAQTDVNPKHADHLKAVAESLEKASATLTGLRTELSEIRLKDPAGPDPRKISELANRCQEPLKQLAGGIETIRRKSADTRVKIGQARDNVRFWARTGAGILGVVFVWFGLGQLCLIGWGWRRLRTT